MAETKDNLDLDPLELVSMADQLAEHLISQAVYLRLSAGELLQVVTIAHRLLQKIQTNPLHASQQVLEADALLKMVSGEFFVRQ